MFDKAIDKVAEKFETTKDKLLADSRIIIRFVDQGARPDTVTQFELGLEVLEHFRNIENNPNAEPSQRLLNLIAAMVKPGEDSEKIDPHVIIDELFKNKDFILRIREIDWQSIEEERKAWEAVEMSL